MGKQKGKNLTKNDKAHTKEASPKPKEKEPPQAPPGGGDVPGGIRILVMI